MLECYFIDLLLNFFTNTPSVQFFLSSIQTVSISSRFFQDLKKDIIYNISTTMG